MKKKIALMVAFGCLGASAASVNYDILGRKGSKMNSPMVYKNVDYSKAKKNEQQKVGSSLEPRALHRTGMTDDVAAVEGSFRSYQSNNRFSIKRHYYGNPDNCNNSQCLFDWNGYKSRANSVFIPINEYNGEIPNYETVTAVTHSTDNGAYSFSWRLTDWDFNSFVTLPSRFKAGQNIKYFSHSRMRALSGFAYSTVSYQHFSNVGIYMSADALPVSMDGYDIKYVKTNTNETFVSSNPVKEMEAYKTYHLLSYTHIYAPVVYVGRNVDYGNPASKVPQVYMGVRIKNMSKGPSDYSLVAKNLDNFIYKYRTVEFVPAGNYGVDGTNSQGKLNAEGRAANAITVGAVDPSSGEITNYTSRGNYNLGSQKPEIFNYAHAILGGNNSLGYGVERTYTKKSNNATSVYQPVVDGTEAAAAYTAEIVSNVLSLNPFYRWHPEIVKAFLLTAGGNSIKNESTLPKIPSGRYLLFDYSGNNMYHYDSRYWNGSIENLKNRTIGDKKEIWFVTKNLGSSTNPASAAISWLSSGNDIANIGRIPQDFDLSVYGSNNSNYEKYTTPYAKLDGLNYDNPGEYIAGSFSSYNAYEKVSIASNYKYLIFRIQMFGEDDRSENKGQVVMGFNMAALNQNAH